MLSLIRLFEFSPHRQGVCRPKIMLKVAHRTLEVLEYICRSERKAFTVRELSGVFGVDKTSMFRMLRVLTDRGYLQQEEKAGHYSLGLKLLELSARVSGKIGLLEVAYQHLERLSVELKETVNLAVMRDRQVVYIHKIDSPHFMHTDLRIGSAVPAHCCAPGKAMLAWYPPERLQSEYNPPGGPVLDGPAIPSFPRFLGELEKIRANGYAVDDEESIPGIVCIAAAILDSSVKPLAAISVAGPALRLHEQNVHLFGGCIRDCAARISLRLGYRAK